MRGIWSIRSGVVLTLFWVTAAALCGWSVVEEVRLDSRGVRVPAVVHDTHSRRVVRDFLFAQREQQVGFVTRDGRRITATIDHYGWGSLPDAGDRVEVEYDERHPETARYAGDHGDAGAAVVMGGLWLALTVHLVRRVKRSFA